MEPLKHSPTELAVCIVRLIFAARPQPRALPPVPIASTSLPWSAIPLARRTTPEEIAAAVRFILAAPAMTGQMIALDGGQHLLWASRGGGSSAE